MLPCMKLIYSRLTGLCHRIQCRFAKGILCLVLVLVPGFPCAANGAQSGDFEYNVVQSNVTITHYSGGAGIVAIPDTIAGMAVTTIGDRAFFGCFMLTNITLPDSVTSIGAEAFRSCSVLTNVTLPDSVTTIGSNAFYSCRGLTSVTLPDSVTSIGPNAFSCCSLLTRITVGLLNPEYSDKDGVLFNRDQTTLIQYPVGRVGGYDIPNGVTNIESQAFSLCVGLTNITLPGSLTSIGDRAFNFCITLTSITLPASVTSIGSAVFLYTVLTNVTVDVLNSQYSDRDGVVFNRDHTTLIQYPPGRGESYDIPDSVTSIGDWAFSSSGNLTSITLPDNVTSIGDWAFYMCSGLKGITLPDNVTSIGQGAFSSILGLKSITLPNSVTSIRDHTFDGCSGLTNITVGNRATSIGSYAFVGCLGLTTITLPNNVTSIGDGSFYGCSALASITLPDGVTSIGDESFRQCTRLTDITLPNSLTNIEDYAFASCTGLKNITIGNRVTSVGTESFFGCTGLTTITLPNSVASIGDLAFYDCGNLAGVYCQGNAPHVDGSHAFGNAPKVTVYYLPGTTGWDSAFGGRPTALWSPQVQTGDASFGVRSNRFGFTITGNSKVVLVVEACANLANPVWSPVGTKSLAGGSSYFSDAEWTNSPARFYRLRSP